MKRWISVILVIVMCFFVSAELKAAEVDGADCRDIFLKEKFKDVFPEYTDRLEECDSIAEQSMNASANLLQITEETTAEVTETVTRKEDGDIYMLTFYSDGGYTEVALLGASTSASLDKGNETSNAWKNCKVQAYLMDPGIVTYTGGMIGDSISFYKSGTFFSNGYGNYLNAGVLSGYEGNVAFISKASTAVSVAGVATGQVFAGDYTQTVTKPTKLTITLKANADPVVTFGY